MKSYRIYTFFILVFLFLAQFSFAQMLKEDPAYYKKDSMYYKIEHFLNKKKYTKYVSHFLFRTTPDTITYVSEQKAKKEISSTENRYIRHIYVDVTAPFGKTKNKEKSKHTWTNKLGNDLHIKTREFEIKTYLLFKTGQRYNAQKIYESERLLRSQRFISRISIVPIDSTATKDSIDVAVNILDSWSFLPRASISTSKLGLGFNEVNFLGTGHELTFDYGIRFDDKAHSVSGGYSLKNLFRNYVNASAYGSRDFDGNEVTKLQISRDFFSPLTRWTAGLIFTSYKQNITYPLSLENKIFTNTIVKANDQDYWLGYRIPIRHNQTDKITDNIEMGVRHKIYNFIENPDIALDPMGFFKSYKMFLGAIGYSSRKYKVLSNVFQYNFSEDIPYGKDFSITNGAFSEKDKTMPYIGLKAVYGGFFKNNYFNFRIQYGRFINEPKDFRSSLRVDAIYFSPLIPTGFGSIRHFFFPSLVIGNQFNNSYYNRINFSADNEFPPFDANYFGKEKFILRYQAQMFIEKTWKNFHFSPYFSASLGWLSLENKSLLTNKTDAKYGIGIIINNPYLVFSHFQISLVYYPSIPFDQKSDFGFNTLRNTAFSTNFYSLNLPNIVNF